MTENFPDAAGAQPERSTTGTPEGAATNREQTGSAAGIQHTAQQQSWTSFPQQGPVPNADQSYGSDPLTAGFSTRTLPQANYPIPQQRNRSGKLVAGVAVLALLVGGGAGAVGGYLAGSHGDSQVVNALNQSASAQPASNVPAGAVTDVANKVLPTVVVIRTQQGEGSGIIVSSDGLILTNNHVIESAAGGGQIEIDFQDGKTAQASIIGRDPTTDIAVVKAKNVSGLPTAQLGTSSNLQIGQQVVAVGTPFDLSGTVTTGIISSLHRPVNVGNENQGRGGSGNGQQATQQTVLDAIQTDAAINPGNSGGPLVNMQGQVIGINSAIASPNSSAAGQGGSVGIGFAIPIDQAKRIAQELEQNGKATQATLGVSITDAQGNATSGALVRDVTAGGAADQAGIKSGDVVVQIDDRKITSADALVAAVHSHAPGDKVTIKLASGKSVQATLTGTTINVQN